MRLVPAEVNTTGLVNSTPTSDAGHAHISNVQAHDGNVPFIIIQQPPCQWILWSEIDNSRVRIWDLMILLPNALFLLFLLYNLRRNIEKLRTTNSTIFAAFYGLVCVVCIISVLRCVVSMTVNASVEAGDTADKILWLLLRFFLLGTEASVVIFGIYFGHLDSRTSIQRVLMCTSFFALVYSSMQGYFELKNPTKINVTNADNTTESFDLFSHGGMIFLCTSSLFFCIVYCVILILPLTCIRKRFILPTKRSFYYYVGILAVLNLAEAIGSLLQYKEIQHSLCVIDVTTYLYFTLFDPLVYGIFLWNFFRTSETGIHFSYKHQVDDVLDDDQLSLPYQTPFVKGDGDSNSVDHFGFGSTHFDRHPSNTPTSSSPSIEHYASVNSDYFSVQA